MTKAELRNKVREAYWQSVKAREDFEVDKASDLLHELRWLRWQLRRVESWHGSQGLALTRDLLLRTSKNCSAVIRRATRWDDE